jgi:hypothetical protein
MNTPAKISDLTDALEVDMPTHITYFDRHAGQLVSVDRDVMSGVEEADEERLGRVPDWQKEEVEIARAILDDSGDRFIDAPDRFDFNEYKYMESFIETAQDPSDAEELGRAIRGKGAFRYFKDTAERLGLLEQWFRYRDEAMKEFIIAWAEANSVPLASEFA